MTARDFRRLALSFPATTEEAHKSHPDFRLAGKIFATIGYPDAQWAMVKLTPEQQAEFVAAQPAVFIPVKGGWGGKGPTCVKLGPAKAASVRALLRRIGAIQRQSIWLGNSERASDSGVGALHHPREVSLVARLMFCSGVSALSCGF